MSKRHLAAVSVKVEGVVQRVGFRRFVDRVAKEARLSGFVENRDDGTAFIFAQGEKQGIDRFLSAVKNAPAPIAVESLMRKNSRFRPSLKSFRMKLGSTALEVREGFGGMETQFADYREEFRDYREEFKTYRGEFGGFAGRTDENFRGLGSKLDVFATRTDENFKLLNEKYEEISEKLTGILETLQKESAETRVELKRSVDNLSKLVDAYIAQGRQQPAST